jgi:serine/threonine protein kinase
MASSCPEKSRWGEWLQSRLSESDRLEMTQHLEGCPACQRLLDELSGGAGSWAEVLRAATQPPPPEAELARVLEEMKHSEPGGNEWAKAPLTFLRASSNPEHLGQLDQYEILGEVGRGGMGVVLKAHDPKLQRVVAIKVLAPHLAASAAARQRFLREARAAAAVAHEHVVTIHAVEESPNSPPYLVMQYVAGRNLQDRIDAAAPLGVKEIVRIGMQAASGLAAAHAQGQVHRDIKPANILLENGIERVKLADFGLARTVADACLTQTGAIAGSPLFMAPEQARGESIDHRADLFALGGVMYAMCTGRPPFRAENPLAILKRVCEDQPRPIRDLNPDIPDWLNAIILKLLAKDPKERFQSASEVADLLGQHLRHLQQPDSPAPPAVIVPSSAKAGSGKATESFGPKKKSSNRALWLVLACLALGLACCIGIPVLGVLNWVLVDVTHSGSGGVDKPVITESGGSFLQPADIPHRVDIPPPKIGGPPPPPGLAALDPVAGHVLDDMILYGGKRGFTVVRRSYDEKKKTVIYLLQGDVPGVDIGPKLNDYKAVFLDSPFDGMPVERPVRGQAMGIESNADNHRRYNLSFDLSKTDLKKVSKIIIER